VAATERGLLFAAYVVADGAFAIFAGMRAALPGERWWTLMLEGIANLTVAAPCSSGWRLR
jgi:hypothetical protein